MHGCVKLKTVEWLRGCRELLYPYFSFISVPLKKREFFSLDFYSYYFISNDSALNQLLVFCFITAMTFTPPTSDIAHNIFLRYFWISYQAWVICRHKQLSVQIIAVWGWYIWGWKQLCLISRSSFSGTQWDDNTYNQSSCSENNDTLF
jgi:hypothetical protein